MLCGNINTLQWRLRTELQRSTVIRTETREKKNRKTRRRFLLLRKCASLMKGSFLFAAFPYYFSFCCSKVFLDWLRNSATVKSRSLVRCCNDTSLKQWSLPAHSIVFRPATATLGAKASTTTSPTTFVNWITTPRKTNLKISSLTLQDTIMGKPEREVCSY